MSDNCDHNFGTFDDFGVKNDQKVSNNMILMSKYKGKHGGKKGQKIRAWVDPPPYIRAMPERKRFFSIEVFPKSDNHNTDFERVWSLLTQFYFMICELLSLKISHFKILLYSR